MRNGLALFGALLLPVSAAMALPPRPVEHGIVMANMRFGAAPAHVKAGDTIVWINRDVVPHTASALDGSFHVIVQPRQSARITIRRAGNIAFNCRFHPAMRGNLRVTAR